MGKYFDDIHASWKSQLSGAAEEIADSDTVSSARLAAHSADGLTALGDALTRQLRYREAAKAYSAALEQMPDDLNILRRRAGRYLSTLQCRAALEDLERCLILGGDELDIRYRMGLCHYFMRQFPSMQKEMLSCFPLCDDEMGIAVIFWHTVGSYRLGNEPILLEEYSSGMAVGHHTAYERAVSVFAGVRGFNDVYDEAMNERDDLESSIMLYGLYAYASHSIGAVRADAILTQVLQRDGFWPCYAYLAAWNDAHNRFNG